jgi:hypothetical protein
LVLRLSRRPSAQREGSVVVVPNVTLVSGAMVGKKIKT